MRASLIEKSKFSEDIIYIGGEEEFALYKIVENNEEILLQKKLVFEEIDKRISKIAEIKESELWLTSDFEGIYKIEYEPANIQNYKVSYFTIENGLPTNE